MIGDGWAYVVPAYIVALGALAVLAGVILVGARHWAKRARDLDRT